MDSYCTDNTGRAARIKHPFEVLIYAAKHGYPALMDVAETGALKMSPTEAFSDCFPPTVYIAWVRLPLVLTRVNTDRPA